MKRMTQTAIAVLLIPLTCLLAGGADTAAADQEPDSESPLPVAQQRSQSTPSADARVARSRVTATELAVWQVLHRIERLASSFDPQALTAGTVDVDICRRQLIPWLGTNARSLLEHQAEFQRSIRACLAALETAPHALKNVADEYRHFAAEEPDSGFARSYRELAVQADTYARAMRTRQAGIEIVCREIDSQMQSVARSIVFLEQLDRYLSLIPSGHTEADLLPCLQKIRIAAEQLAKAMDSFSAMGEQLQKPVTMTPVSNHRTTVAPPSSDCSRQRLLTRLRLRLQQLD